MTTHNQTKKGDSRRASYHKETGTQVQVRQTVVACRCAGGSGEGALNEKLRTQVGYLLLAPTYRHLEQRVGRICSMEPGIAKNGTVYSHLNTWMILGLLRNG